MTSIAGNKDPANGNLSAQQIEDLLRDLGALPTMPAVAPHIMELAIKAQSSPADIIGLLSLDPALSARLLYVASRRLKAPVACLQTAADAVGADTLVSLVLSGQIAASRRDVSHRGGGLPLDEFWRHCLATACAAQMLAERSEFNVDPSKAYLCGLLHDLGKLVLDQCLPKSYSRIVSAAKRHNGNISQYERDTIGVDHSLVGLHLARVWNLGSEIETVLWLCHHPFEVFPQSVSSRDLVVIVCLGDTLARENRMGFSGNLAFDRSPAQIASQLGIAPGLVEQIANELPSVVAKIAGRIDGDSASLIAGPQETMLDAAAAFAGLNERLLDAQPQLASKACDAELVSDFVINASSDTTIADVLKRLAATVTTASGILVSAAEPLIVYSLSTCGDTATLVAIDGGDNPRFRTFPCRQDASLYDAGDKAAAVDVVSALLDSPEDVNEWVSLAGYAGRGLTASGRCAGGVLWCQDSFGGGSGSGVAECLDSFGEVFESVLSLVQQRCEAIELGEQLTGASQRLVEMQEATTERKTLATVGEMAAGAGHEMNNPLAVICGRAQLMLERATDENDRRTWQQINEQGQRISDAITDLMELASPPMPKVTNIRVADIFAKVVEVFGEVPHERAGDLKIDIGLASDDLCVAVDAEQVVASLGELVLNAANSLGSDDGYVRLFAELDDVADAVLLTVSDDGKGMSADTLENVFTPFFSFQDAGRRRGLGLPRARRLISNNDGKLWLRSQEAQGTTAYIQLPRAVCASK